MLLVYLPHIMLCFFYFYFFKYIIQSSIWCRIFFLLINQAKNVSKITDKDKITAKSQIRWNSKENTQERHQV